ncbi:helix-turn-helix domain-containing protein [Streptomyces sp. TRM43335]|uniref:Helix-turn-helix domain-containing protein n=1 Tax=Streptomyces taklimakanensis TaxID=2569853 RepID=A0A6G2BD72_9ACTN|nr:helix-turn-helix domain-containing protein [Streptomyces taklimakanensis]MTE20231.1 helix-turn-helix domain-containing protein [Streptomyces taklimakanensis]
MQNVTKRRAYKISEVAEQLSVSLTKAKELTAEGGPIKSFTIGRSRRVSAAALDAYIAAREAAELANAS